MSLRGLRIEHGEREILMAGSEHGGCQRCGWYCVSIPYTV